MIDSFSNEYRFLSNFYPAYVEYDHNVYRSVEHAFQAAKTLDYDWRARIHYAATPADAKKLGRKAPLREDWEEIKVDIMKQLLIEKFSITDLRNRLLWTQDKELVEGNWWGDTFWGVCRGIGHNMLGKLLMEIREEIRNEHR